MMNCKIEKLPSNAVKINFSGRLDVDSVTSLWTNCLAEVTKLQPQSLVLELAHVDYIDSAGMALLQVLQNQQTSAHHSCTIQNLKPDFQQLFDYINRKVEKAPSDVMPAEGLTEHLGHFAVNIVQDVKDNIIFLGIFCYQLFFAFLHPKKIRWLDFWRVASITGPQALFLLVLIGFLIGLISTFQAAPSFGEFGVQIFMVNLVGLGLIREMGPLMTSVLLAGRTASSFAAEIGTMKINQEIDALTTMGLNPIKFLVIPRVLATVVMTPIASVFLITFGLIGCFIVMFHLGYPLDACLNQLYSTITISDCLGGLVKTFAFSWVIASVGCLYGIRTKRDTQAVGTSTTQAVVSALIMLVIVDGIFAIIYYVLGI